MKKRILCLLLAIFTVATSIPAMTLFAFAEDAQAAAENITSQSGEYNYDSLYVGYNEETGGFDNAHLILDYYSATPDTEVKKGANYDKTDLVAASRFIADPLTHTPFTVFSTAEEGMYYVTGGTPALTTPWKFLDYYVGGYWAFDGGSSVTGDGGSLSGSTDTYTEVNTKTPYYLTDGKWSVSTFESSFGNGYLNIGKNSRLIFGNALIAAKGPSYNNSYTIQLVFNRVYDPSLPNDDVTGNGKGELNACVGIDVKLTESGTGARIDFSDRSTTYPSFSSYKIINNVDLDDVNTFTFTFDRSDRANVTHTAYVNNKLGYTMTSSESSNKADAWAFRTDDANIYAIRVYDRVLTADEIAQNHFADLAKFFRLDVERVDLLTEQEKAAVYTAVASYTLESNRETVQNAVMKAISSVYKVTYNANGDYVLARTEGFELPISESDSEDKVFVGYYVDGARVTDAKGVMVDGYQLASDIVVEARFLDIYDSLYVGMDDGSLLLSADFFDAKAGDVFTVGDFSSHINYVNGSYSLSGGATPYTTVPSVITLDKNSAYSYPTGFKNVGRFPSNSGTLTDGYNGFEREKYNENLRIYEDADDATAAGVDAATAIIYDAADEDTFHTVALATIDVEYDFDNFDYYILDDGNFIYAVNKAGKATKGGSANDMTAWLDDERYIYVFTTDYVVSNRGIRSGATTYKDGYLDIGYNQKVNLEGLSGYVLGNAFNSAKNGTNFGYAVQIVAAVENADRTLADGANLLRIGNTNLPFKHRNSTTVGFKEIALDGAKIDASKTQWVAFPYNTPTDITLAYDSKYTSINTTTGAAAATVDFDFFINGRLIDFYNGASGGNPTYYATDEAADAGKTAVLTLTNHDNDYVLGEGGDLDIYAVRIYAKTLTTAEIKQNHFADLAKFFRLDISGYHDLTATEKAAVHAIAAGYTFESDKDTVQYAISKAIFNGYKITYNDNGDYIWASPKGFTLPVATSENTALVFEGYFADGIQVTDENGVMLSTFTLSADITVEARFYNKMDRYNQFYVGYNYETGSFDNAHLILDYYSATPDTEVKKGENYYNENLTAASRFVADPSTHTPFTVFSTAEEGMYYVTGGTPALTTRWKFLDYYVGGYWAFDGGSSVTGDGGSLSGSADTYTEVNTKTPYYLTDGKWSVSVFESSFGNGYLNIGKNSRLIFGNALVAAKGPSYNNSYTIQLIFNRVYDPSLPNDDVTGNGKGELNACIGINVKLTESGTSARLDFGDRSTTYPSFSSYKTISGVDLDAVNTFTFTFDRSDRANVTHTAYVNNKLGYTMTSSESSNKSEAWAFQTDDANIYAIRVYDRVLSTDEIVQNHFVDIAKYYMVDVFEMEELPDAYRNEIYGVFSSYRVGDNELDVSELQTAFDEKLEEVKAVYKKFDDAKGIVTFEGYQARIRSFNGLRSLYSVDESLLADWEADGYSVEFGAIMAVAIDGRVYTDLAVAKNESGATVATGSNMVLQPIYRTGEGYVGNIYDEDKISFVVTITYERETSQTKAMYETALMYRAYIALTDNATGEVTYVYVDNESPTFGETVSMYEIANHFTNVEKEYYMELQKVIKTCEGTLPETAYTINGENVEKYTIVIEDASYRAAAEKLQGELYELTEYMLPISYAPIYSGIALNLGIKDSGDVWKYNIDVKGNVIDLYGCSVSGAMYACDELVEMLKSSKSLTLTSAEYSVNDLRVAGKTYAMDNIFGENGKFIDGGVASPTTVYASLNEIPADIVASNPIVITFLGASNSEGGSNYFALYANAIASLLKKNVVYYNAGVGGSGSDLTAARFYQSAGQYAPDIIVLDENSNDTGSTQYVQQTYVESILYQANQLPKVPVIIFNEIPRPNDISDPEVDNAYAMVNNKRDVVFHYGIANNDVYASLQKRFEAVNLDLLINGSASEYYSKYETAFLANNAYPIFNTYLNTLKESNEISFLGYLAPYYNVTSADSSAVSYNIHPKGEGYTLIGEVMVENLEADPYRYLTNKIMPEGYTLYAPESTDRIAAEYTLIGADGTVIGNGVEAGTKREIIYSSTNGESDWSIYSADNKYNPVSNSVNGGDSAKIGYERISMGSGLIYSTPYFANGVAQSYNIGGASFSFKSTADAVAFYVPISGVGSSVTLTVTDPDGNSVEVKPVSHNCYEASGQSYGRIKSYVSLPGDGREYTLTYTVDTPDVAAGKYLFRFGYIVERNNPDYYDLSQFKFVYNSEDEELATALIDEMNAVIFKKNGKRLESVTFDEFEGAGGICIVERDDLADANYGVYAEGGNLYFVYDYAANAYYAMSEIMLPLLSDSLAVPSSYKNMKSAPTYKLVFLGDSNTAGAYVMQAIDTYLQTQYAGVSVEILNAGTSGASANGALATAFYNSDRSASIEAQSRFEREVLANNPDAMVICFGINDLKNAGVFTNRSARQIAQIAQVLDNTTKEVIPVSELYENGEFIGIDAMKEQYPDAFSTWYGTADRLNFQTVTYADSASFEAALSEVEMIAEVKRAADDAVAASHTNPEEAYQNYTEYETMTAAYTKIIEKCRENGIEVIIATPVDYDETRSNTTGERYIGVKHYLERLKSFALDLAARTEGVYVVDYYGEQIDAKTTLQAANSTKSMMGSDITHFTFDATEARGPYLAANAFMSDIIGTNSVFGKLATDYAFCAEAKGSADGVTFYYRPTGISMAAIDYIAKTTENGVEADVYYNNVLTSARALLEDQTNYNKEIIKVTGLDASATYTVTIDGVTLATTYTGEALAEGVDISLDANNPYAVIANEVSKLLVAKRNLVNMTRTMSYVNENALIYLLGGHTATDEGITRDEVAAQIETIITSYKGAYLLHCANMFMDNYDALDSYNSQIDLVNYQVKKLLDIESEIVVAKVAQ